MPGEFEIVTAAIRCLETVLRIAPSLRRDDCCQPEFVEAWQTAIRQALAIYDTCPIAESPLVADALLAARSALRRIADSGEARIDSASHGRSPNSSLAGRRFNDDIRRLERCIVRLRELLSSHN